MYDVNPEEIAFGSSECELRVIEGSGQTMKNTYKLCNRDIPFRHNLYLKLLHVHAMSANLNNKKDKASNVYLWKINLNSQLAKNALSLNLNVRVPFAGELVSLWPSVKDNFFPSFIIEIIITCKTKKMEMKILHCYLSKPQA